jgi:hypothetical protein
MNKGPGALNIEYVGCFFDPRIVQDIQLPDRQGPLYRTIAVPHVTLAFLPVRVSASLFGTAVTVKVVGYGCDGENEALLVEFVELPNEPQDMADQVPVPHITLSVSQKGKPVNSRNLEYHPMEPFFFQGIFGAMDVEGVLHLEAV